MVQACDNTDRLIEAKDCLLLLIDVQERLMPVIENRDRVLENLVRLVRFSRLLGLPVMFTEQDKLGPTVPNLKTELADLDPVGKVHFNCFYCDAFRQGVESAEKKTLLIAGVEAHICVAQTVLHGLSDFAVHVVADGISSRSPENRTIAIERMRQAGAIISSTEMIMYELLKQAGTDYFRAALRLIK
jgi:nicotinamidase-related amidase